MKWILAYYNEEVMNDILNLPDRMLAKYQAIIEWMIESGPNIGLPHTRSLQQGLFEIRLKGKDGIARIFYCNLREKEVVMLHTFIKKHSKHHIMNLKLREIA